jgi:ribosomal protein S18 acetylase RimI-like enzyme
MNFEIKRLTSDDVALVLEVGAGAEVFDHAPREALTVEFLRDPRHHLVAAVCEGRMIGFVSAVHYVHPDKAAELWINEVGVAEACQNRGVGKRMMEAVLALGRELGCVNAWVLTDRENAAAMRLYAGAGGVEAKPETVMYEFALGGVE